MKKLLCGLLAVLLFPVVLSTIPCTVPAEETNVASTSIAQLNDSNIKPGLPISGAADELDAGRIGILVRDDAGSETSASGIPEITEWTRAAFTRMNLRSRCSTILCGRIPGALCAGSRCWS